MEHREEKGSGILPSNVGSDTAATAPIREPRPFPWPLVLGGLLILALGVGLGLGLSGTQQRPAQVATSAAPTSPPLANPPSANPRGTAANAQNTPLAPINGISCDALESTIFHIHIHLAIFVNGEEQEIPFGVGIGEPWQVVDSDEGPFVDDGSCFYWIHTHTADGVLHIESPVRRRFTLGDFFAIWGVPLSSNQIGSAQGPVIVYVNGQRDNTNPPDIPLLPHERIQLDIGGDVAPYPFDFPPDD